MIVRESEVIYARSTLTIVRLRTKEGTFTKNLVKEQSPPNENVDPKSQVNWETRIIQDGLVESRVGERIERSMIDQLDA